MINGCSAEFYVYNGCYVNVCFVAFLDCFYVALCIISLWFFVALIVKLFLRVTNVREEYP